MGLQHHDPDVEPGADECTSSAIIGSPLWPQSFGRTMDIYSRSTSQRSDTDPGLEGTAHTLEPTNTTTPPTPTAARTDCETRQPLLTKPEHHQSQHPPSPAPLPIETTSDQGSSFFQALFNGMNVLAGTYAHICMCSIHVCILVYVCVPLPLSQIT
jgi:hypothetical protein